MREGEITVLSTFVFVYLYFRVGIRAVVLKSSNIAA